MLTDGRTTDGRTDDGQTTDAGVTGILIAHLGAFGSGELKIEKITYYNAPEFVTRRLIGERQKFATVYRKMEYFRVAKFSRFCLKNMRINIRGF